MKDILNPQKITATQTFSSKLNDNTFDLLKMRWFNTFEVAQFFRFIITLNWLREKFSKSKMEYRVLADFGCSKSQLYTFWRNNGNYFGWPRLHYYGIDAATDRLNPNLPHKANDNYQTVLADLAKPLMLPEKADAIVCMEVLEHLPKEDARQLMSNIYNNLKPKGIVIMSSPNPLKDEGEEFAWSDSNTSHHYEWSFSEVKNFVKLFGFKIYRSCGLLPRRGAIKKSNSKYLPYSFIGNVATIESQISSSKQWMIALRKDK